ncbi:unnamed protein product [Lactuca saligna]|uniref:CCHC-type domain-containing protein n=1 Tax=Lactuca saligna TaxID=75948 RepID=A0AA35VCW8_LACSI|nr:unnamed protein product [Lactuca saligna]
MLSWRMWLRGNEDAVNNPPPLVPPPAPQFPNNNRNNGNNNNVGAPIIQIVQPQLNRNNHGQNGGNRGNWAQNMGGNVGNHNDDNVRNQNQNPRNVGPQFGNGSNGGNEDDWDFDDGSQNGLVWNQNHNGGNRRNQGNRGGNGKYNNNWNNKNFPIGGNNDFNDGFGNQGFGNQYRRNPNGGFSNANGGYYNEGNQFPHLYFPQPNRQSMASHFQLGENDDASPILFAEGNEHHVEGQKICVSCGDSGHIADECMRSQEEINQVHDYGQFQNNPRSFNWNYNHGGNYNNNGNFNNNKRQGNYQNQNQPKQFQQSNFNQGGTSKKEETDGNKLDKIMEFIIQTYQKADTNSKSIAAIEKQIAQLVEKIGKREDGKFPSIITVNPYHT